MTESINKPYKKKYKNGILINPINGFYPSRKYLYRGMDGNPVYAPNRSERRNKRNSINNREIKRSRSNRQIIMDKANKFIKMIIHDIRFKHVKFGKRKK